MRIHVRHSQFFLLAFVVVMSRSHPARAQAEDCAEDIVYPPHELVHGRTLGEWSARNWQWLLGIPKASSPVLDPMGERCAIEQDDDIFFLSGDLIGGTKDIVREKCFVPCGRDLFVPLFSSLWWAPEDCDPGQIADCRERARIDCLKVSSRELHVDGRSIGCLEDYRAISPEFQFTVPPDNILSLPPPPLERTFVAEGFYVIVRALAPGKHTIKMNVVYAGAKIPSVTYVLTVCAFRRGDSDGNGDVNVTDAVTALNFLFAGADSLPCLDAADANDDGGLNVTDALHTLLWLFQGGTVPPAPGPTDCGVDPTEDSIDCTRGC